MKIFFLTIALAFSTLSLAQSHVVCSGNQDLESSCELSYRVLAGLAKGQEKGRVPRELILDKLHEALKKGQVEIRNLEDFKKLPTQAQKGSYLFNEMVKKSGSTGLIKDSLELNPSKSQGQQIQLMSGTRGGGMELPEEWWIWY